MPHSIDGCAIVTGASRGIGAQIAKTLAENGFPVVVNYNSSETAAKAVADEIINGGGEAFAYKCDVASSAQVEEMVAAAIDKYGKIYALVNNAGISEIKLFTDITEAEWQRMTDVTLGGAFHCCKSVLPHMIHEKRGRIVNISSVWGVYGASCEVHYSTVKAGLIGMTKALAKELAPSGITVNAIAPGCIMTDMLKNECDADTLAQLAADTPVGRLGTPSDAARAAAFLIDRNSDFITGQVLGVDGGFY